MLRAYITLLSFLFVSGVCAQQPKRELRGVFLTTTNSLDWPKSQKPDEQQASLREIILDMKKANLNAVFFQVRARGDAYYKSRFEPWAENLTGTLGKDPGWDPLQFLIDECRNAGIEVHAWFNVYKIRGPVPPKPSSPQHPVRANPQWAISYADEWWFDPGIPDVQDYLIRVLVDLTEQYDIDGVCYDFIRYPGRDFPDQETFRRFGKGAQLLDWRRANIAAFTARAYATLTQMTPMLKIGAAPVGNYGGTLSAQPGSKNATGGFTDYAQDARGWIADGSLDYVAPQVYWTLEFATSGPDFAHITRAWQRGSAGRHTYVSIGAYKPEIMAQIPDQIVSSRMLSTQGQIYFRYENVAALTMFGREYDNPAFLPTMQWKDSIPPLPPQHLEISHPARNIQHLRWEHPDRAVDGDIARSYAIYRATRLPIDTENPASLIAITVKTEYADTNTVQKKYFYAVTALDKGNNESVPAFEENGSTR